MEPWSGKRWLVLLFACAGGVRTGEAPAPAPTSLVNCTWSWRALGCIPAVDCKLKWKPRLGSFGPCVPHAAVTVISAECKDAAAFAPTQKEHFDSVYNHADPRPYYVGLQSTEYRIPWVVARAVAAFAEHAAGRQRPLRVIDFGCGYGAVGAMLRHNLTMRDVYSHYAADEWHPTRPEGHRALDRQWYAHHRDAGAPEVTITGLDVAGNALAYAVEMGLIDAAAPENLVSAAPSAELREQLLAADLVVEAGAKNDGGIQLGVFRAILATGARPHILRVTRPDTDMGDVDALLARTGYATTSIGPLVRYRKPLGQAEEKRVLELAAGLGISAAEAFTDGYIAVRLRFSVPAAEHGAPAALDGLEERCRALGCFD